MYVSCLKDFMLLRVSEVFPMCHQGDITDVHFDAAESIKKLANYVGRLAVFGLQVIPSPLPH